ncbi:MAG TPA: Ig-like domain-containing protein [Methylomirabilota bacterium]|nr:Ig-like domain-containing protein [Methylomirabilota bacterium]
MAGVLSLVLAIGWTAPAARAQSATVIGGGLTALPTVTLGPNKVSNSGFESGAAAPWSGGSGWSMDQLTRHTGTFSYRRDGGAPTATTTLQVQPGTYKFSAWVKTQSLAAVLRLQFDFRPGINDWRVLPIAGGTADWTLYELKNVVVTQPSTITLKLETYTNGAGTAWFDDVKLEEQLAQSVEAFLLYPNFRGMLFDDGPSTMKFDLKVTPPGGDFGRYSVRGTLKDEATGQVVATHSYPASASFVADLDGAGMQSGRGYLATFALIDGASGAQVYAYPAYRVSRAPAAARQSMNVSFDAKNRVLIKGVPRFVLGVYDSGMGYSTQDSFWENALWSSTGDRRMDNLRINMYLNYWYGEAPADAMNALMGNLQKHGVTYLQTGNCFDKFAAGSDFMINSSDAYAQQIGAHPGSAGFYTIDECLSSLIPGAFTQYNRLRRLVPDSITFSANFGNAELHLWRDTADIIATDPYPMFGAEPSGGYNHRQVADWTAISRDAVKGSRPIMTVLQFFKFTSLGRWPTLTEMRNHAYMAIVEGARGLWWWSLGDNALKNVCSGWCADKTTYMNNLKSVVNEIAALEPALLADDAPGSLRGNSNANIKTKVKLVNGKGYLFAYNATNGSQTTSFTWNTAPGTVAVNGENRSIGASGSSFSDTFGPYAAHVYVIGNGGTGGTGGTGTTPPPPGSPTVSFSAPAAGTTVSGTTTVTVAGTGGSGSGYTYTLTADAGTVSGSGPSFAWNTTAAANGTHTLTATVKDSAGRTGTATRSVTVSNGGTTSPGTTPTVSITQPANGSTVTGMVTVSVSAAAGSTAVAAAATSTYTYALKVDGAAIAGAGPSFSWDTTKIANGAHTLTATATDGGGRTGASTSTVTVSNQSTQPPANGTLKIAITQPKPATTVSGTAWATLWLDGGTGTSNTYSLTLGGKAMGSITTASRGPVSVPYDTKMVADGSQPLVATVRDNTGNSGTSTVTVTTKNGVTTSPPPASLTASITSPAAGTTVSGTSTVGMSAAGSTAASRTFQLAVDGAVVSTQTVSGTTASFAWNTASLANGSHTLGLTVTDTTGGRAAATTTVTVSNTTTTPSTTPPPPPPASGTLKVAITQPTSTATVRGTTWAVLWVEGQSGTSNTFSLFANGKLVSSQVTSSRGPVSLPWITTAGPNGAVALQATVKDATGNTGASTINVTVGN